MFVVERKKMRFSFSLTDRLVAQGWWQTVSCFGPTESNLHRTLYIENLREFVQKASSTSATTAASHAQKTALA